MAHWLHDCCRQCSPRAIVESCLLLSQCAGADAQTAFALGGAAVPAPSSRGRAAALGRPAQGGRVARRLHCTAAWSRPEGAPLLRTAGRQRPLARRLAGAGANLFGTGPPSGAAPRPAPGSPRAVAWSRPCRFAPRPPPSPGRPLLCRGGPAPRLLGSLGGPGACPPWWPRLCCGAPRPCFSPRPPGRLRRLRRR